MLLFLLSLTFLQILVNIVINDNNNDCLLLQTILILLVIAIIIIINSIDNNNKINLVFCSCHCLSVWSAKG